MAIPDRVERINNALEPLVEELLSAGVRLNAVRNMHFLHKEDYPIGLPIVLAHLEKSYDDLPRSIIAGTLCYTKNVHVRAIWPEVARLYSKTANQAKAFRDDDLKVCPSNTKAVLANALLKLYEPKRLGSLINLVRDKSNGETRVVLLGPLLRVKNRRKGMMGILIELKTDPELEIELSAKGIG